jgi:hypothetical protein
MIFKGPADWLEHNFFKLYEKVYGIIINLSPLYMSIKSRGILTATGVDAKILK